MFCKCTRFPLLSGPETSGEGGKVEDYTNVLFAGLFDTELVQCDNPLADIG